MKFATSGSRCYRRRRCRILNAVARRARWTGQPPGRSSVTQHASLICSSVFFRSQPYCAEPPALRTARDGAREHPDNGGVIASSINVKPLVCLARNCRRIRCFHEASTIFPSNTLRLALEGKRGAILLFT